jgi:hypothetical protein
MIAAFSSAFIVALLLSLVSVRPRHYQPSPVSKPGICGANKAIRRAEREPARQQTSSEAQRRYSAVDMQRWKAIRADPFLYAREVCDAAMYPVNDEQGTVKHAYPYDHISLPPVPRHIIHKAADPQVVRSVFSCVQRLAAFPIDR